MTTPDKEPKGNEIRDPLTKSLIREALEGNLYFALSILRFRRMQGVGGLDNMPHDELLSRVNRLFFPPTPPESSDKK